MLKDFLKIKLKELELGMRGLAAPFSASDFSIVRFSPIMLLVIAYAMPEGVLASSKACEKVLKTSVQNKSQAKVKKSLINFSKKNSLEYYTYPGAQGATPVVAMSKDNLSEYLNEYGNNTISIMYRRSIFHSYIRIGNVLFDIWGDGDDNDIPGVHVRDFEAVFSHSKKPWVEAMFEASSADIELLLQFYFYRAVMSVKAAELYINGEDYDNPWYRYFKERGVAPFNPTENCTGFVLSAFNPNFYEEVPTPEQMKKHHEAAESLAQEFGLTLKYKSFSRFLVEAKKLPQKYQFDMVAAPPGLMRMANIHPKTKGFFIHNFNGESFRKQNKMGFDAKYGGKRPIDLGFDKKISNRK